MRVTKDAWAKESRLICLVDLDAGPMGGVLHARSNWIDPRDAPPAQEEED